MNFDPNEGFVMDMDSSVPTNIVGVRVRMNFNFFLQRIFQCFKIFLCILSRFIMSFMNHRRNVF